LDSYDIVTSSGREFGSSAAQWRLIAIAVLSYVLILRLVFSGIIDLLPEEGYYWNYAQHLDIGYLDHPPMVAWLIWLSTWVLGDIELAVRAPAYLAWFLVAFFVFRLTANMFDKAAAYRSVLLVAVLPIYFSIGFLMTPDAPLYAAWAGCLYFLERAFIGRRRRAWWGVGLCMGLGMLSKYTIGLLGLAVFVYLLVDRPSRQWLLCPEPYLAGVITIILFSPVLFWNWGNDWASFAFQGPRRWSGSTHFSLHLLIGGALVLLTPTGFFEAIRAFLRRRQQGASSVLRQFSLSRRKRLFMFVFAMVPLFVFVLHSLRSQPKLNWSGPVWLAVIPLIAWNMVPHSEKCSHGFARLVRKTWLPTIAVLLLFYTTGLGYIWLGLPGVPPQSGMPLPVAWEEFGERVEEIESDIESETGSDPLIVGLDKYWISSELSFYDGRDDDVLPEVGGQHIFDKASLMWNFWVPKQSASGRNVVVVSFHIGDLDNSWMTRYFSQVSPISTETIMRFDRVVGHFFWRLGYNYRL
jgi:dolichol-phosphate mannosyltransferase